MKDDELNEIARKAFARHYKLKYPLKDVELLVEKWILEAMREAIEAYEEEDHE